MSHSAPNLESFIYAERQGTYEGIVMRLNGDGFFPKTQPTGDTCFPTSLKIILDGLRYYHKIEGMALRFADIAKLSNWRAGYGVPEDLTIPKANLNKIFRRFGYMVTDGVGASMSLDILKGIVQDDNRSAPIVTVGVTYFADKNKDYTVIGRTSVWHQLVVTGWDEATEKLEVFDTLNNPNRVVIDKEERKHKISLPEFSRYWNEGDKSTIWIEKTGDKAKGKVQKYLLEESSGNK